MKNQIKELVQVASEGGYLAVDILWVLIVILGIVLGYIWGFLKWGKK